MIRAIRLELVKPIGESWEEVGPLLRTLAKATPKLLNAAMDACVAIDVVGKQPVASALAAQCESYGLKASKAKSRDGLAYPAVKVAAAKLTEWGEKKKHPFAGLDVPGDMAAKIARAATQAHGRRDQGRVSFASERILVGAGQVSVTRDERGNVLSLGLRSGRGGAVRFAVAHSWGAHRETLDGIVAGTIPHGDCKLQWDERRRKWYALLSYEPPAPAIVSVDPARALAVHRGIRNALFLLTSTGHSKPLPGGKFMWQRRGLQARMRDSKRVSVEELGSGAKGHGRARRYERYDALEGKLARVTHTFCQQAAAFVAKRAKTWGCGLVIIEDYGGIELAEDPALRRVLDRFPLYELKQAIASRLERDGLALREVPAAFISTTCPRCRHCEPGNHNRRTGMFHCRACVFERPADWVAAYWMLKHGGADMTVWDERLRRERELAEQIKKGA